MDEMTLGRSAEDYLEAMLILQEKNGYVRSVDIAEQLGVTKPSVSVAVKRLRESGYIEMNRSGFITFTEDGLRTANKVYTRHKALTRFFEALGVDHEIAAQDACQIEHVISEQTFRALCAHAQERAGINIP